MADRLGIINCRLEKFINSHGKIVCQTVEDFHGWEVESIYHLPRVEQNLLSWRMGLVLNPDDPERERYPNG